MKGYTLYYYVKMTYCWAYKGQKKKIVIYSDRTMDDLLFPFLKKFLKCYSTVSQKTKTKTKTSQTKIIPVTP